jgi:uncharacterized membrane protein YheB (UPF0754 family)
VDATQLAEFQRAFFTYAFPIIFYTFHGYIATVMAIALLFHPYEPIFLPWVGWQLPMTPGIFPKRRPKLAQAVASTVTDTLLTTADIKVQVETLLTEENIYLAVDGMVNVLLTEFRDTTKLHRLANEISELSPAFLEQLVVAVIEGVEQGKHKNIAIITEKIFDQIVLTVRISRPQADEAAQWIMESVITPSNVRGELIRLLSPQNIQSLENSINQHASGPYKILARIIGVKRVCYEWRNFLEKEPDQADKILTDLLTHFRIEEQIADRVATFDLRSLPMQTIAKIRQQSISLVEEFLVTHKEAILNAVRNIQGPAVNTVQSVIIRFNPEGIRGEWLDRVKKNVAQFCYGYLKQELGGLLERAIPQLGVYGIISRKIELFTPQQLETVVKRICKNELRYLEYLGAFIGFGMGCIQAFINTRYYGH